MKRIALMVGCCFMFFASCEKEYLVPEKELPQWLKTSIEKDLEIIAEDSSSMKAMGKWTRTEWRNEFYYEYTNMLLCSISSPISHNNDTLKFYQNISDTIYYTEKCCEVVVWKGPRAI